MLQEPILLVLGPLLAVAIATVLLIRLIQQNRRLAASSALLRATLDSSNDGILVMDLSGQIVLKNELFDQMWHGTPDQASASPTALKQMLLDQVRNPAALLATEDHVRQQPDGIFRDRLELRDGRMLERVTHPRRQADQIVGRIWTFRDITSDVQAEQQVLQAAMFDSLTGLPNRTNLVDRLGKLDENRRYAVAIANLDRFKHINDTLGHAAGDAVICETASRLRVLADAVNVGRPIEDHVLVARMGPDEFAILLLVDESAEVVLNAVRQIQQALASPFDIAAKQLFLSVSIGIAMSDLTHTEPLQVLRDADTALYRAKSSGKGKLTFFQQSMRQSVASYFQIENDLRRAIEGKQLETWYQPLVSLRTGRLAGFEALVRWRHPEKGIISPGDFIPIAEDTGLVVPIGMFVLDQAIRQVVQWNRGIREGDPLFVSVNLSRRQLIGDDALELVRRAARDQGVDPTWLKLEVTESMVMDDLRHSSLLLAELRKEKIRIHLDDFGTGHSSLATLKALPVDGIKIDQAFVSCIKDGHRPDILNAIMTLSRGLGMEVVAEGIETAEQLAILVAMECDLGQGYLFGRPATAGATETILAAELRAARQGKCYWNAVAPGPMAKAG